MLLPVDLLLRRADAVTVIGAALLAKAAGSGHRRIAVELDRPASTVRGWCRRMTVVAGRVRVVLLALAAEADAEMLVPNPTGEPIADVLAGLGVLTAAATRRLGPCTPWRLAAAATDGRLLAPAGPAAGCSWINTTRPWSAPV